MLTSKQILPVLFCAAILINVAFILEASAAQPADKDATTTKHYHFPFVHVDVARHKDGSKDYDVKAPFTRVHNPAGTDNAEVKAPFYKAEHNNTAATSKTKSTAAKKSTDQTKQM